MTSGWEVTEMQMTALRAALDQAYAEKAEAERRIKEISYELAVRAGALDNALTHFTKYPDFFAPGEDES